MASFSRDFFQKYKIEIIIFGIALSVRLIALFLAVYNYGEGILQLSDSSGFINLARSIVSGTGYSRDGGLTPHVLFVPGYPFFSRCPYFYSAIFGPF